MLIINFTLVCVIVIVGCDGLGKLIFMVSLVNELVVRMLIEYIYFG